MSLRVACSGRIYPAPRFYPKAARWRAVGLHLSCGERRIEVAAAAEPAELALGLRAAEQTRRRLEHRFRLGWAVLGGILAAPLPESRRPACRASSPSWRKRKAPPALLSTHPLSEDRRECLQAELAALPKRDYPPLPFQK